MRKPKHGFLFICAPVLVNNALPTIFCSVSIFGILILNRVFSHVLKL